MFTNSHETLTSVSTLYGVFVYKMPRVLETCLHQSVSTLRFKLKTLWPRLTLWLKWLLMTCFYYHPSFRKFYGADFIKTGLKQERFRKRSSFHSPECHVTIFPLPEARCKQNLHKIPCFVT